LNKCRTTINPPKDSDVIYSESLVLKAVVSFLQHKSRKDVPYERV